MCVVFFLFVSVFCFCFFFILPIARGAYYLHKPSGWKYVVHTNKTIKSDVVYEPPTTCNVYPKQMNRLKRVEKLHPLKSQPISPEDSQTESASHLIFHTEYTVFPCKW